MPSMPDDPFHPIQAVNRYGPGTGMSTSGNTSSTGYMIWTETTQTLNGWWERVWEWQDDLIASSCGSIKGSWILYHMDVTTRKQIGDHSFASGLTLFHDIDYFSDSVSGGWGTSGLLYTVSAGYTRVSGIDGEEGVCNHTIDSITAYLPGQYDLPNGQDTSATWLSQFNASVNTVAQIYCPDWNPTLVIL